MTLPACAVTKQAIATAARPTDPSQQNRKKLLGPASRQPISVPATHGALPAIPVTSSAKASAVRHQPMSTR
jgi:hypothetical protein